jgi:hypothetical protein
MPPMLTLHQEPNRLKKRGILISPSKSTRPVNNLYSLKRAYSWFCAKMAATLDTYDNAGQQEAISRRDGRLTVRRNQTFGQGHGSPLQITLIWNLLRTVLLNGAFCFESVNFWFCYFAFLWSFLPFQHCLLQSCCPCISFWKIVSLKDAFASSYIPYISLSCSTIVMQLILNIWSFLYVLYSCFLCRSFTQIVVVFKPARFFKSLQLYHCWCRAKL